MNLTTIIEKIKDIISSDLPNKRVFDKDVANALGLSKESLTHFKKRNSIPYEQIAFFCATKKISINWLLFDQEPKSLEEQTERYSRIKYFKDINASAGGGAFNFEESYEMLTIDKEFLNNLYKSHQVNIDTIAAINVIGDSMEPTLLNQEVILFDTTLTNIEKDGIFVISSNSGLFVKRMAKRVDGSVELISDNKNYNNETLSLDEQSYIRLLGKVIGKVGLV